MQAEASAMSSGERELDGACGAAQTPLCGDADDGELLLQRLIRKERTSQLQLCAPDWTDEAHPLADKGKPIHHR